MSDNSRVVVCPYLEGFGQPRVMDNSDSKFMFLDRGRDLVPRWLFVGHRLTIVIVFCLMTFTVLTVITAVILGGYTVTTWLLFVWERVTSGQVNGCGPAIALLC